MAFLEDGQKKLIAGIALGAGVSWVAREFLTPFGQALRPLAKAGIKSGIRMADRGRETLGRLGETVDDLVAEVKAEQAIDDLTHVPVPDAEEVE